MLIINALGKETKDRVGPELAQYQNYIRSLVTGPRGGPDFDEDVTRGK